MLLPINWLKEYVNVDKDINEFAEMMTVSGSMVETVTYLGEGIEGVVTAKIKDIKPHEDAEKLVICTMFDGSEEYQVVTGAKNVKVGDIVPYAKVGAKLPNGMTLKKAKLRGVESYGMLCSGAELGMSSSIVPKHLEDGIYIFSEDVPLGEDAKKVLGLDEYVIDFELTNNRQDCNSILGMAYEAGATLGKKFVMPDFKIEDKANDINDKLSVEVKNTDLCKRYCARMLKVKKVEQSPLWMQQRLMACGIRPISNIVDVSNYVMLELGQPLHMFDYDKLEGHKIIVDTAKNGEKMVTLDNIERDLDDKMLLINDAKKGVCVAGVMGALNSVVDDDTKNIVIESANFNKNSIRRTSRVFGLRSEASAHYEKGINPLITRYAIDRAASLLVEIGACELVEGLIDENFYEKEPVKMDIDSKDVNRILGSDISVEEQARLLDLLNFEPKVNGDIISITAPILRDDINIKEDVVEEIARMYGYNNIPSTLMETSNYISEKNVYYSDKNKIKEALIAIGGLETLTYTFTSKEKLDELGFEDKDIRSKYVKVINPLGEDTGYMRTSMMISMLESLSFNYSRKNKERVLFEIGNVFFDAKYDELGLPLQEEKLVIGKYNTDYFEIKGIVEYIFNKFRIKNVKFTKAEEKMLHPTRSAYISVNDKVIGYVGNVHPLLLKKYNLKEDVVVAEIDVKTITENYDKEIEFKQLAKFPSLQRDIAVVVDEDIYAGEILDEIKKAGGEYLVSSEVFDVFTGKQVGEGKKSVAVSLEFRAEDRTLTDEEIDVRFDNIVKALSETLNAKLR